MTPGQAKQIREFSINWIRKVVGKKKDYKQKLVEVVEDLFPENIDKRDPWSMLGCKDWDWGEEYIENGRKHWWCSLARCITEGVESYCFGLTKKAQDDIICTVRIATDLLVSPSGGVIGYTVGDLKKAFDGDIPEAICAIYEGNLKEANDDDGIWL